MANVLIVDDATSVCDVLARFLNQAGHSATPATSATAAIQLSRQHHFDIALIDLRLPDQDGLATFDALRRIQPSLPAILITGYPVYPQGVVSAIRRGFANYLEKPISAVQLVLAVQDALPRSNMSAEQRKVITNRAEEFPDLVGRSAAMDQVRSFIRRVAPTDETVLIQGETGTGKELVARAMHACSRRTAGAFAAVNCAAVGPDTLLESELFGHERGAYTGADSRAPGWFEWASGGTLFLDEVGELSRSGQAMLLRALEVGQVVPVGARKPVAVDVRIVAATNVDLGTTETFRRDLFYRLNALDLCLPPLRDRPEDIPDLIRHILPQMANALRMPVPRVSEGACTRLRAYEWPGNVRELQHELRKACLCIDKGTIEISHLSPKVQHSIARSFGMTTQPPGSLRQRVGAAAVQMERRLIREALNHCSGNMSAAAKLLGISRRTLQRRHPK